MSCMILSCVCAIICAACLIYASFIDIRTHMVPDYIWWIFAFDSLLFLTARLPASSTRLWYQSGMGIVLPAECLFVIFIQEKIMSRFYGRADSHAFSCCEIFFCFCGMGLCGHILHLAISLVLLTAVQFFKGNIGEDLKLKEKVAFIPYISVSFFISMAGTLLKDFAGNIYP